MKFLRTPPQPPSNFHIENYAPIRSMLSTSCIGSPIIGATRPEQVRENAKASAVKLSMDELAEIETILKPNTEG